MGNTVTIFRLLKGLPLLAALLLIGCGRGSSPNGTASASAIPSAASSGSEPCCHAAALDVTDLVGAWSDGSATLTLGACTIDRECGRLERIDDNGEYCAYAVTYRSADREAITLQTGSGSSFGCARSPWSGTLLRLMPGTDHTVELAVHDVPAAAVTLAKVTD